MLDIKSNSNLKKLQFWIIAGPLFLSLIITLIIFWGLNFLPSRLPLFYSLPWGNDQLAIHEQFLIIPISIAGITVFNFFIVSQLHPSQSFFKKILTLSPIIICLIFIITFIKIILNFI